MRSSSASITTMLQLNHQSATSSRGNNINDNSFSSLGSTESVGNNKKTSSSSSSDIQHEEEQQQQELLQQQRQQPSSALLPTEGRGRTIQTTTKNVTFASINDIEEVHNILHINDMKEEIDISTIWYTKDEYKQISDQCRELVHHYCSLLLSDSSSIVAVDDDQKINDNHVQQQDDDDDNDNDDDNNNNNNDQQQQQKQEEEEELLLFYYIRGLEYMVEETMYESNDQIGCYYRRHHLRRYRRMDSLNAVFDEQNLQHSEGINDSELLADIYFQSSYECQINALHSAKQDENDMISIYKAEEEEELQQLN